MPFTFDPVYLEKPAIVETAAHAGGAHMGPMMRAPIMRAPIRPFGNGSMPDAKPSQVRPLGNGSMPDGNGSMPDTVTGPAARTVRPAWEGPADQK